MNVVSASLTPPAIKPIQLELLSGRACPLKAKPATDRDTARRRPVRRDGVEDGSTQRQRSVRRRQLRAVGKRIRGEPESAVTRPGRESEVAKVPLNFGKTGGREGPLLSSSERNRERQPDCPRRGRLNPGPVKPGAKRPRDPIMPAICNGRYTGGQATSRGGLAAPDEDDRRAGCVENRMSGSMRGRWKRAISWRACVLPYRSPWPDLPRI